jgi:DNA-binding NarL/FixJ family response regulator
MAFAGADEGLLDRPAFEHTTREELEETSREAWAWLARIEAELVRLDWVAGTDPAPSSADLIEAWRTSVAAFDRYGHVFEAARSRARLAAALHAAGDDVGSREVAAQAREVAVSLGAAPLLAELDTVHPSAAHSGTAESALTPREVEVLGLLAQGLTNGQIGRQLFISTKTVSVHVSNLLAKLGASGRTEAAAIARRRGLVHS